MSRSAMRRVLALVVAMLSLALVATPAMAETTLVECNGTCGYYQVTDMGPTGGKGAVCKYEKNSYDLDFISVRPPLMHGPFSDKKTKVQWKFKILRASSAGNTFSVYHTSTWQSALANTSVAVYANHGFERRYWYAPENPTGKYKVRIFMRWWNRAGSSVIGKASLEYDWYQRIWSTSTAVGQEYCIQDW